MGTPIWKGSLALVEQPTSPQWQISRDGITVTRIHRGPYSLCLSSAPLPGALAVVDGNGVVVHETFISKERGRVGLLTVVHKNDGPLEAFGAQLPLPEAGISNEKQERPIKKHHRYASLSETLLEQIDSLLGVKKSDADFNSLKAPVQANPLAWELYLKMRSGHVAFWYYTPVYSITEHDWSPPTSISAGGFIQNPPVTPIAPPGGTSLGALRWLREGDQVSFNGAIWQRTRKWVAIPDLDTDIYPAGP